MVTIFKVTIFLILIGYFSPLFGVDATMCYVCDTLRDKEPCMNADKKFLKDCTENAICSKTFNGKDTARGCKIGNDENGCAMSTRNLHTNCHCDSDECNLSKQIYGWSMPLLYLLSVIPTFITIIYFGDY